MRARGGEGEGGNEEQKGCGGRYTWQLNYNLLTHTLRSKQ